MSTLTNCIVYQIGQKRLFKEIFFSHALQSNAVMICYCSQMTQVAEVCNAFVRRTTKESLNKRSMVIFPSSTLLLRSLLCHLQLDCK